MKQKILFILSLFILYIFFGTILYVNQRSYLYYPKLNTPHIEKDHFLKNDNERIQIIQISPEKDKAIIYFGGNAEVITRSIEYIKSQFPDYAIYMMNYRNFGLSTGETTQKAIFSDALALYDYVNKKHKDISIGGRSLGTSVASYVASKKDVRKLALITPFNSIKEIAQDMYFIYPMNFLLKDTFQTEDFVKDIKAETLIITASEDRLVPKKYSDKLIEKFKEFSNIKLNTIEIKGHNHRNISSSRKYFEDMRAFIN